MVELLVPDEEYEPDLGEYYASSIMVPPPSDSFMATCHPASMAYWAYNPFEALKRIGVSTESVRKICRVPRVSCDLYSQQPCHHLMPNVLLASDLSVYSPPRAYRDMVEDKDWMRGHMYDDLIARKPQNVSDGIRGMMGSGYTDFTLPSDGSPSIEEGFVKFTNGDYVHCFVWAWYNK